MDATININLRTLRGAFTQQFQDQCGHIFECVCIPIGQAMLYKGESGIYIDGTIKPNPNGGKRGYDHYIKQNVPKMFYSKLTDEEKKCIPIIGNAKENETQEGQQAASKGHPTRLGNGAPIAMKKQELEF